MDISLLAALEPAKLRGLLTPFLTQYVADASAQPAMAARMTRVLDGFSDEELAAMLRHMGTLGESFSLYEPDPCARALTRGWAAEMLPSPEVHGLSHLSLIHI